MTQESLSKWLKGIIAGIAVCGAVIFPLLYPMADRNLADGRSLLSGAVFWMEDYHGN